MNRNPVIPFVIIMVFGIVLMFALSFKGLGDTKNAAKDNKGTTAQKTETAASNPEGIYKSTCLGCHGEQYQGGAGPALKGVGARLTVDQIKEKITTGKNNKGMPPNLVPADQAQAMAEWVSKIK
jgi:cytochrome c550